MRHVLSQIKKNPYFLLALGGSLLLFIMCFYLLWIGQYNYPAGDDFGYSAAVRQALQSGGNPIDALRFAVRESIETYFNWQGSYSAIFLMALQPGIWGTSYYALSTWILLGTFLLAQFYCFNWILHSICGQKRSAIVFAWSIICCMQIFHMPYPNEAFYWFNGSIYYTFFYSMSLVYFTVLGKLVTESDFGGKRKRALLLMVSVVLGFFVAGGNLATGLALSVLNASYLLVCLWQKKSIRLILPGILVYWLGFLLNIFAPGNSLRQSTTPSSISPLMAIWLSVEHAAINIFSWSNVQILLLLLCLLPIIWISVKKLKWDFPFPLLFVIFCFGVYAAQLTPITYVNGSFGPKRMGNVSWESYFLLILSTEFYLVGWLQHRRGKKTYQKIRTFLGTHAAHPLTLLSFTFVCCFLLLLSVFILGYKDSSVYQAYRSLRIGEAKAYATEVDARIAVLEDPTVLDIYFHPLENHPVLLFYCDISENSNDYFNISMAEYYGKNRVNLIPSSSNPDSTIP